MSFSLSATPPPMPPSSRRQRGALLLASALIHVAVLVPVALNIVFLPTYNDVDHSFEVWIDMERDVPRPEPRTRPEERVLEQPVQEPELVPEELTVDPVREQIIEQIIAANPQITEQQLSAILPQIVEQRSQITESLDAAPGSQTSELNSSTLPGLAAPVTRPVIEAIDGPTANAQVAPLSSSSLPSLQTADREGQASSQSDVGALDAPVPRRARIDDEAEAALAAAARGGALDDAWTYRPEAGGGAAPAQGGGQTDPMSGQGGLAGNTATRTGRIYYGQGTTPVDCTQPQMLSDVQRLSCDSAEARRIRQAIERGVRVGGSGNASRDAQLGSVGAARMENYESLRRPASGGTGNPILNTTGSGRGAELDALSGTNREIRKIQEQIGASNGPRPPPPDNE